MSIDDEIVAVDITAATTTATKQGFGVGMFACFHTLNTDLFRLYKSLSGLVADGFGTSSAAYRALSAWLSQDPRPKGGLKIGRLTTSVAHTVELTMTSAVQGKHVKLTIVDEDGNSTAIDYTIVGSETTTTVATAVEALVEAVTGITSSPSGAVITAVGTTGKMFWYKGLENCTIKETTPDANIEDDLIAIQAIDDDWYGVATPYKGAINVEAVATWVETQSKKYFAGIYDSEELTSGGVVGAALKSSSDDNTTLLFCAIEPEKMNEVGEMSLILARQPGSYTAKFKTIKGVQADSLNPTQIGYLDGDNINHFTSAFTGGISMLREGKVSSGRFLDSVIGQDWLTARIKESVFGAFQANDKLPFDNDGLAAVGAKVKGVLKEAVRVGYLRADPPPAVFVPDVDDIDESDRADRNANGITFTAKEAGAIHSAKTIQGSVT